MTTLHSVRPLAALALCAGCGFASYEAEPLEPEQTLAAAAAARAAPPPPEGALDLAHAVRWLRERNPRVRASVAAYEEALAEARAGVPLPNPELSLGPSFGIGPDIVRRAIVPFAALGLTIPLAGAREARHEQLVAAAEVARVDAVLAFRDAWLELRARWCEVALARARRALQAELVESAARAHEAARRLVDAGGAGGAEVALLALAHARAASDLAAAEQDVAGAVAALAALVDVDAGLLASMEPGDVPDPGELPALADLQAELPGHHPELVRGAAAYLAAERALRAEVAAQYPDLGFAPSYEGEVNERYGVLTLPVGIELPLFARNQAGVARASAARARARVEYEAACSRALAELARARAAVAFADHRVRELRERVLPLAERSVDLAERALASGSGAALDVLQARAAAAAARLDVHEAERERLAAWFALERACGRPLLSVGGEPVDLPEPPGVLHDTGCAAAHAEDER